MLNKIRLVSKSRLGLSETLRLHDNLFSSAAVKAIFATLSAVFIVILVSILVSVHIVQCLGIKSTTAPVAIATDASANRLRQVEPETVTDFGRFRILRLYPVEADDTCQKQN